MTPRQTDIIRQLSVHAGGSRAERIRSVEYLVRWGYTLAEITTALRLETERLKADHEKIAKLNAASAKEGAP